MFWSFAHNSCFYKRECGFPQVSPLTVCVLSHCLLLSKMAPWTQEHWMGALLPPHEVKGPGGWTWERGSLICHAGVASAGQVEHTCRVTKCPEDMHVGERKRRQRPKGRDCFYLWSYVHQPAAQIYHSAYVKYDKGSVEWILPHSGVDRSKKWYLQKRTMDFKSWNIQLSSFWSG